MNRTFDFEDIRPYYDEEINPALKRITANPVFSQAVRYLFPKQNTQNIISKVNLITSAIEFQKQFMDAAIRSIIEQTSDGLSSSGFENITPGQSYVFIANHRDILLDSAIFQVLLLEHGFTTTEITFGSNLMTSPFIIDIGRVNRMFKVFRNGTPREMLLNSMRVSAYIRNTITQKKTSIWIAQRRGRTKDGFDFTEPSVIKMLSSGFKQNFSTGFKELRIVPLAISYEYEPCDVLKTRELLASQDGPYIKKPNEDFDSILNGITQHKGRINVSVGKPVVDELENMKDIKGNNEKIKYLTNIIDKQIYRNYKLWPTNYIAADLLHNNKNYIDKYTSEEKKKFISYYSEIKSRFKEEQETFRKTFLGIYANPVKNCAH